MALISFFLLPFNPQPVEEGYEERKWRGQGEEGGTSDGHCGLSLSPVFTEMAGNLFCKSVLLPLFDEHRMEAVICVICHT